MHLKIKKENIDLEIYDVKKCVDKMWVSETSNDIYDACLTDDNFVLVTNACSTLSVAVKTPWDTTTERITLENVEMQGTVITPLKCSVQIDSFGKEIGEDSELSQVLYKYKGVLKIPALAMIDDLLTITKCGINSVVMNGLVQSKMDTKRFELGAAKCFQMHVGKDTLTCPTLKIRDQEMDKSEKQKYLGDIISSDAKIYQNIKIRSEKGMGIVNQIMSILREISFGHHHFEMAMLLRSSLLLNGILFNTEALMHIYNKHMDILESCDKILMGNLFHCPRSTPLEA